MPMWFWGGMDVTFLLQSLTTDHESLGTYFLLIMATVLVGFSAEVLNYLLQVSASSVNKTLLYFCMSTAGYAAMLLVMTFNIQVILAVVFGLTAGNYTAYRLRRRNEADDYVRQSGGYAYRPALD